MKLTLQPDNDNMTNFESFVPCLIVLKRTQTWPYIMSLSGIFGDEESKKSVKILFSALIKELGAMTLNENSSIKLACYNSPFKVQELDL